MEYSASRIIIMDCWPRSTKEESSFTSSMCRWRSPFVLQPAAMTMLGGGRITMGT